MSLRLKMVYSMCAGAWGGYLAWLLLDPFLQLHAANSYMDALVNGAMVGLAIGLLVTGFEGLMERNLNVLGRRLLSGLVAGVAGGVLGLLIAEIVYQFLGQLAWTRLLGWGMFGAAIGVGEGLAVRSWRRVALGAAGGLLGGLLGGAAFSFVRSRLDMPEFSRALGFTLLGAFIGLFVGLMPVVIAGFLGRLKVVSSGRNEGKEILLDRKISIIGASERCDLALYGKSDVAERHAQVQRERDGYSIRPLGQATVWVNGQPTAQQRLVDGDRIRIGSEELIFRGAR